MALLAELIDIPLSIQRDDFVLKLDEGIRDDAATKTLPDYVITPQGVELRAEEHAQQPADPEIFFQDDGGQASPCGASR